MRLPRLPRSPAAAVFVTALAVRLLYLFEGADAPTFDAPIVDAATYDGLARRIVSGAGIDQDLFWQPVFYPLFLAAVYRLAGPSLLWAKIAQCALGAATCALTCRLGRGLLGPRVGLVAGMITALYGPLIFFDGELVGTGWACFWSVALLSLARAATVTGAAGVLACAGFGLCGGLAALTRPDFLPFLAFALPALAISLRRAAIGWRGALLRLSLVSSGFAAIAVPAALATREHAGRLSILPASAGINLWIGNNPDSARTVAIRPGWEWDELTRLPARHGVEHKRDTSRFFRGRALGYARAEPWGFLGGLARKAVELTSSRELPRNVDIYVFREWSSVLRVLVWKAGAFGFPFGLLLPLALVGGVVQRRRLGWALPPFLVLYAASIVLVFVSGRYRMPLVPALAVPAAAGALGLLDAARTRRWKRCAAGCAGVALGATLASLAGPFPQERHDSTAEMLYMVGTRALRTGDASRAAELIGAAIERVPGHGDAHNQLGNAWAAQGRTDLALEHYRRAVELGPRNVLARDNYARALLNRGRVAEAVQELREALRLRPTDASLNRLYGAALLRAGDAAAAIVHFRRWLERDATDPASHVDLARALVAGGETAGALAAFETALRLDPLDRRALDGLASILDGLGRQDEATARWSTALAQARQDGDEDAVSRLERMLERRPPTGGPP